MFEWRGSYFRNRQTTARLGLGRSIWSPLSFGRLTFQRKAGISLGGAGHLCAKPLGVLSMALESTILKGNPRLDRAASGGGSIRPGPPHDDPEAVKRIQKGLKQLGYPLPLSFPNGYDKDPDGVYGEETRKAVVAFQRNKFPNDPQQWDGRSGPNTLREMDGGLAKGVPDTPPPPPKKCTPKDDTIPTGQPYDAIPEGTMKMLQRSYRERDAQNMNLYQGFGGDKKEACPQANMTFREVLDNLTKLKSWPVLEEMRTRSEKAAPGVWSKIKWLHEVYDYETSRGIWCCIESEDVTSIRNQLKNSKSFCSDNFIGHATHQKFDGTPCPSQCYRELNNLGKPGLHLCTMVGSAKPSAFGEWHNFHIDPHQIGSEKGAKCACWYAKVEKHFGDVGPYCVDWFVKEAKKRNDVKMLIVAIGVDPEDPQVEKLLYKALMAVTGGYDNFVDMADNPGDHFTIDPKGIAALGLARIYKEIYLAKMAPQYDP